MREVDFQDMILHTLHINGGRADKLSHRFKIGVSDLIVKLKDHPAGFLEVKQRVYPRSANHFKLDVTGQQQRWLDGYSRVGMPCGVASFLRQGEGNSLVLYLRIMNFQTIAYQDNMSIRPLTITATAHEKLSRDPALRLKQIYAQLDAWLSNWSKLYDQVA